MNILIIEDETKTAKFVQKGLFESGYFVDVVSNGMDGLYYAASRQYDVIILDLMLPKMDGWKVLKALRATDNNTNVIILSAISDTDEKVKLFDYGADDYLVKPFSFSELHARIKAIQKRTKPEAIMQMLQVVDLSIDCVAFKVSRQNKTIELTIKEYLLLLLLIQNINEVLNRNTILDKVWGINFESETNIVDVTIRRLRKKIDDDFDVKLIHSIRGLGYVIRDEVA